MSKKNANVKTVSAVDLVKVAEVKNNKVTGKIMELFSTGKGAEIEQFMQDVNRSRTEILSVLSNTFRNRQRSSTGT